MTRAWFGTILILAAMTFAGCGKPTYQVDPTFQPFIQRFEKKAQENDRTVVVNDLIVEFGDAGVGTSGRPNKGLCTLGAGTPHIAIDKTAWNASDDLTNENTIFHELGHCILKRKHRSDTELTDSGLGTRPVSMMNPTALGPIYKSYHDDYVHELFTGHDI